MNSNPAHRPPRHELWRYPALVLLFALAIGGGGLYLFHYEREGARRDAKKELTAIADLKAGQITNWLQERRGDAEIAREYPRAVEFLADPTNESLRRPLLHWMAAMQQAYDYRLVALFDSRGVLKIAVPADALAQVPCAGDHVRSALAARNIVVADLHRPGPDFPIHMSILAPIGMNPEPGRPAAGVLLFVIDPYRFLYPLVQDWPMPSSTAETLLVRREGDDVVFLNELRHRPDTALALRFPLDPRSHLPAARAVLDQEDVLEGADYRGVPVLAATRKIQGTPWFMVAKVDQDEIYGPGRRKAAVVALAAFLLFLTAMLSIGLMWRSRKLTILSEELSIRKRSEEQARSAEEEKRRLLEASERSRLVLLSVVEDQKRAEEALRMSEAKLSNAMRMSRAGHWEYDVRSDTFTFNDNFYRIFGTTAEEAGGYQMSSAEYARRFCHPDDAPLVGKETQAALETTDPNYSRQLEHRILYPNGDIGYTSVLFSIIKDAQGRTIKTYGVNQDITERKKAEDEKKKIEARLQQQQRLESIGTLASGVAHEINNPVNGIMNYAQLIADNLEPGNPLREYASEITTESDRISAIVRNLLAFSRHEKQSHSPADLRDIVNSTLGLVRTVIRHDQIRVDVDVPDNLPKVKCRSQQIQQVLLNLLTNARDALNEKYPGYHENKVIKLTVRLFEKDGKPWLRTAVENSGTVISPETRERLFEPFYTTKPRDAGTGLGLSISYGIVKEHHGELYLDSAAGEPTRFHMDLPVNNGWSLEK